MAGTALSVHDQEGPAVSRPQARGSPVVLVGDVCRPHGLLAGRGIARGDRDVRHELIRGGAVPVLLTRPGHHRVTGTQRPDRAAGGLHPAHPVHDVQHLAARVSVPGRPGARRTSPAARGRPAPAGPRARPSRPAR
jgi:hypothetical protein